ncbi:MAG: prolyl-tRNA synthetase associated domain-containing protein [Agathobacter sp.]|nr:prolyl-tRNA synthetase associated domain-containing protein [Agathobacter sp.]
MKLELHQGRPADITGRLEKEIRTYDLLDNLGIAYERVDHEEANTMEACAAIDEVLAPAVICKNLFLCNTQQTKFYLLMIKEDKKFKTKEISKQINSSRLSFAPAEYMEKFLDITPGSVSVMGLMNDKENNVQLLVDEDVLKGEYFGCHPCINTSSMRLKVADVFEKFLPAVKHDYLSVKLIGEEVLKEEI